jgi:hypothetical protein
MNFARKLSFLFLLSSVLVSCAPANPASTPQVVDVYATASASPWLDALYACAADLSVMLNVSAESPDIFLRVGEPPGLVTPAFQVGTEDLVVITNNARPPILSADQIRRIFTGQITNFNQIVAEWEEVHPTQTDGIHVWVYSGGEDIQTIFEQVFLDGRSVTSYARVAVHPSDMLKRIAEDENAIGFLPRRWLGKGAFKQINAASVPVLALTPSEPTGVVRGLIACLQK